MLAELVVGGGVAAFLYTYLLYPALLPLAAWVRRAPSPRHEEPSTWPSVSISVPAYNEANQIRGLLESLLAIDYPRDRLQVLIVSDGSDDGTDEIVGEYAHVGIELLRMPARGGKTKAEEAAATLLRGEIVVNTDASIRIRPDALKPLVSAFCDPAIGCASGRDVSVGAEQAGGNLGESGYVSYEMAIRDLETRVEGIVGASGCFYAIRRDLHRLPLPASLSRDFAAALHAREHGFRAVSVPHAVCYVPRAGSLRREYRRKVRTITRGMQTLWHKRSLLNPFRHGLFAWMLFSHKVCRWLLPWAALSALIALGVLARTSVLALALFGGAVGLVVLAAAGWWMADRPSVPRFLSVPAFAAVGNVAAAHALLRALGGARDSVWDPTRRTTVRADPGR